MMRKIYVTFAFLIVFTLLATACGSKSTPSESPSGDQGGVPAPVETVEVIKTVVVTVEVPAAGGEPQAPAVPSGYGETLKTVQERGKLICGVNSQVPGFGFVDTAGNFSGFDVDYCKAVAAAIFADTSKVEYRPVTAQERFTALQTGEIDVLIRNTTWTLSRDTELATNFVATTFYDGQGMMVRKDSGITKLEDLDGGTICVLKGTTTELNLADQMAARGVSYTPLTFETADEVAGAYDQGRCDGFTTDKSGLVARQPSLSNPDDHVILDVTMSKEPLGPAVRHGDDQWFDIIQWTVFTTFTGEELGINSANVEEVRSTSEDPVVKNFLGTEGEMGAKLGLSNDFSVNIIKMVGNYAEIYDRNLGPDTPFKLPRGLNNSYINGGLLYAPPFR